MKRCLSFFEDWFLKDFHSFRRLFFADASEYAIGAVLTQKLEKWKHAIVNISKKFKTAEKTSDYWKMNYF